VDVCIQSGIPDTLGHDLDKNPHQREKKTHKENRIEMSRIFRLAILECETPLPRAKASRGSFGTIFERLFTLGLQNLGNEATHAKLQVSKWDVVAGKYPQPDEFDGIVLTGSCTLCVD